jgi:hypothetical protein
MGCTWMGGTLILSAGCCAYAGLQLLDSWGAMVLCS